MVIPSQQRAYAVSQGTSSIPTYTFEPFDPTPYNTTPNFGLYSVWVNTITKALWYLEEFNASNGVITSQWRAVGPIVVSTVSPTTSDYLYPLGQTWVNTTAMTYWVLVNVAASVATWEDVSSGISSGILSLTGNTGGSVQGDGSRNVNLIGNNGVTVTGNAGTHTLTIGLTGGSTAVDSVGVDAFTGPGTNPVLPTALGEIFVTGGQVPANTTVNAIQTNSLAANTYTVQVQRSTTQPASTVGSNGVAHFNSSDFTIDNNAFVSLASPGGKAFTSINTQVFTSSGTYTPTANMKYCEVQMVAGGAAAGGAAATTSQISVGSGGGGGEYAYGLFNAATIGASQTVTIGAGGTGVSASTGNPGGNTSLGSLMTTVGGSPGTVNTTGSPGLANAQGGAGGTGGTGGNYRIAGQGGFYAWGVIQLGAGVVVALGGDGGDCQLGSGGTGGVLSTGRNASLYGAGGGGPGNIQSGSALAGGNGTSGIVIITEYI